MLQGLTLRPLLLRLGLEDDGAIDREVSLARVETLRAAISASATCAGAATAQLVRYRYELQLRRAEDDLARNGSHANGAERVETANALVESEDDGRAAEADAAVIRAATDAQRRRLVALRAEGTIGDAAFQRVEEELDWAELDWAQFLRVGQREGEAS